MPEIKEKDRQDFEKRLARYGLDQSAMLAQELITTQAAITPLYASPLVESKFRPIVLKTSDFDVAKKWIGVPDVLAEKEGYGVEISRRVRLPGMELKRSAKVSRTLNPGTELSKESLTSEHLEHIREVARGYLRGDSRALVAYKPWLEKVFPVISVSLWPFFEIRVKSGSVLEFGPGPNVLVACSLTIEEGGLVRSYGDLNVDVTILKKEEPGIFVQLDPALFRKASYLRDIQLRRFKS